jgi:hypothetical protein
MEWQVATDMTGNTPPFIGKTSSVDSPIPLLAKSDSFLPTTINTNPSLSASSSPHKAQRKSAPSQRSKRNSRSDPVLSLTEREAKELRRNKSDIKKSVLMELVASFWGYNNARAIGASESSDNEEEKEGKEGNLADPVPEDNLVYRVQPSDLSALYENLQLRLERQVDMIHCFFLIKSGFFA